MRSALSVFLVALLLGGCITLEDGRTPREMPSQGPRPVVTAIIDTGINPYHEAFARGGTESPQLPNVTIESLQLSEEGTYEERFKADEAIWKSVESRRLYGFHGTRILAISIVSEASGPILDPIDHGTGTAFLAATANPDGLVVMVQVKAELCLDGSCVVHPSVATAMEWVADQAWIDVVSVSINLPANLYDPENLDPEVVRYHGATRRAAEAGKLIVNSAGNYVGPPALSQFAGPPWVIAVGGVEASTRGESIYSGRGVDVVANYTALTPTGDSLDEYQWSGGTSFSAPVVAGTLAAALHHVRERQGAPSDGATEERRVLRDGLRTALNHSALQFSAAQWAPLNSSDPELRSQLLRPTAPVLAPMIQMGWGHVTPALVPSIVEAYVSASGLPVDKIETAAFQQAWHDSRVALWSS